MLVLSGIQHVLYSKTSFSPFYLVLTVNILILYPLMRVSPSAVCFQLLLFSYGFDNLQLYCRLTNNILSTAQQVWLQKLGGAKNPVKEYIDKLSREESANVRKNGSAVQDEPLPNLSKPQPSQEPKATGPQRGER